MRIIQPSGHHGLGREIWVDEEDWPAVNGHRWHITGIRWDRPHETPKVYAARATWVNGKNKVVLLHRELLGAMPGQVIDHIDGNGLNNCRSNLRFATQSQNVHSGRSRPHSSQYKGVFFNARPATHRSPWWARIKYQGRNIHIGVFQDERSAALAYNEEARTLFGAFAHLNVIDDTRPAPGAPAVTRPPQARLRQRSAIYRVTNTRDGRIYIGATMGLVSTRWSVHRSEARRRPGSPLHRAIATEGPDAFVVDILATATSRDELHRLEAFWIATLRSTDPTIGYNGTSGGTNGIPTPETRAKFSAALTGRRLSAAHRATLSMRGKGRKQTAAHIAARTAPLKGRRPSEACRAAVADANRRRVWTPESRLKMAAHARRVNDKRWHPR